MSDFQTKLIEVIATKAISEQYFGDLKLPEPFGVIRWTGFKEHPASLFEKHGQIVWFLPPLNGKDSRLFYVSLPSMNHGAAQMGGLCNIESGKNSHHFTEFTTLDEVRGWFIEGFKLLIEDVLNECPWLLEAKSTI